MEEINYRIGKECEYLFKRTMIQSGYKVIETNLNIDRMNHIDFYLVKDGIVQGVDVKCTRNEFNNIGIELVNKNGDPGFIYGKATLIAYQWNESFYIFYREQLLGFSEYFAAHNYVKYHQTPGRKDKYFFMPFDIVLKNVIHTSRQIVRRASGS